VQNKRKNIFIPSLFGIYLYKKYIATLNKPFFYYE